MGVATDAPRGRGASFWVCFAIVLIAVVLTVTFAFVNLSAAGFSDPDALYSAARSIALLVAVLITPLFRSSDALLVVAVALTIVLAIDAFIGAVRADPWEVVGSIVLCLATIVSATFVARAERLRGQA